MTLENLVIRSQLIPPRSRKGVLQRPRLDACLQAALDVPLTPLLNNLTRGLTADAVLVLDDYHLVHQVPEIAALVRQMINHCPLVLMYLVYLLYRRFVSSPTGRVCIAIRENEGRALMLGYNTFYFKLAALTISSITAALAGMLHTLYQPIVTPNVASLGYTISALLIVLIGGVGTLNGALIGAAVFRLLDFGLHRYLGEASSFVSGVVYIAIVLFLPYGIMGTWHMKKLQVRQGWRRLIERFRRSAEI